MCVCVSVCLYVSQCASVDVRRACVRVYICVWVWIHSLSWVSGLFEMKLVIAGHIGFCPRDRTRMLSANLLNADKWLNLLSAFRTINECVCSGQVVDIAVNPDSFNYKSVFISLPPSEPTFYISAIIIVKTNSLMFHIIVSNATGVHPNIKGTG